MAHLKVHESAEENFNRKASDLIGAAVPSVRDRSPRDRSSFRPDYHVVGKLERAAIHGEPKVVTFDAFGRAISTSFVVRGEQHIISGEAYRDLESLASSIRKATIGNAVVSVESIKDALVGWIQRSLQSEGAPPMMEHVLAAIESEIKAHEIWIPIACLHIQSPLRIGDTVVEQIDWGVITDWLDAMPSETLGQSTAINTMRERLSRQIRGLAVAKTTVLGDARSADSVAIQRTEEACSILRIFHPAALIPQQRSFCTVLGRENAQSRLSIRVESGRCVGYSDGYVDHAPTGWIIDDSSLEAMRQTGLDGLVKLYERTERSNLESALLSSIMLYSRVTLLCDYADKLVFLLSSLESLFLKSQSEPIQQNLGERIALLVGQDLDDRKRVVASIRAAYALRSRALHHGAREFNPAEIEDVLSIAWNALLSVVPYCGSVSSREGFLSFLDDRKLS